MGKYYFFSTVDSSNIRITHAFDIVYVLFGIVFVWHYLLNLCIYSEKHLRLKKRRKRKKEKKKKKKKEEEKKR